MLETDYLVVGHLPRKILRRLFNKIRVNPDTDCWEWMGARDPHYGLTCYKGRQERAHRLMYAWLVGPVPMGVAARRLAQLDHVVCRNKICCNPAHLELVTQRVNVLRGSSPIAESAQKTHCKYGHPLTPTRKANRRECKTCDSLRHKERLQGPKREHYLELARQSARRYSARKKQEAAQ